LAARDVDVVEVSGDDGVVDGIEDIEANTMDIFLCPGKPPNAGSRRMEQEQRRVVRPTSSM
jgi:hypothetical protein